MNGGGILSPTDQTLAHLEWGSEPRNAEHTALQQKQLRIERLLFFQPPDFIESNSAERLLIAKKSAGSVTSEMEAPLFLSIGPWGLKLENVKRQIVGAPGST